MFYVIHGYCSPDRYTSKDGPVLEVKEFRTEDEVVVFYKSFAEGLGAYAVTFRVIDGRERKMVPVTRVTEYRLGD